MILISNGFWYKIKMYNFDPYNVLLSIATNMPQTGFVLQGHIYENYISPPPPPPPLSLQTSSDVMMLFVCLSALGGSEPGSARSGPEGGRAAVQ